ncbi:RNA-guided endonuclease InsQ/TnpB family protein, partial [Ralstonia pseudosolanacearum]|uniref:RNA-guided endonuclease InsQ/TnpB family protein n=1 Tax=Ralstonia pseudosolanacearum TaxID=1310165 RepID=UPI003CEF10AC
SVILQQALRDQKAAFDNFFNPKLSAHYPRFKRKYSRQSIRLTKAAFRYKDGEITIAKSKAPLPVRWTRTLPCSPSSITISKDPSGRYFISCLCEFSPKAAPVVPDTTGVEIGIEDLFVTSGGTRLNIDLYTKKREEKLAYLQRQLSKKEKGSNNALKLKKKIARIHAKITDFRRDKIHKATRKLINENQVVCVRLLNKKEFTTGKYPVDRVNSMGWGEFVRQLTYKSEWAGRQIVKVASQPLLFHENSNLIHSARNIKTVGLAGLACGATEVG